MYAVHLAFILLFLLRNQSAWFAVISVLLSLNYLPRNTLWAVLIFLVSRCLNLAWNSCNDLVRAVQRLTLHFCMTSFFSASRQKIPLAIPPWDALNEFIYNLLSTITPRSLLLFTLFNCILHLEYCNSDKFLHVWRDWVFQKAVFFIQLHYGFKNI